MKPYIFIIKINGLIYAQTAYSTGPTFPTVKDIAAYFLEDALKQFPYAAYIDIYTRLRFWPYFKYRVLKWDREQK